MVRHDDILRNVRVAKPCHASWEAMEGDERVRHCGACNLNVFNLSGMTRSEAEELILEKQGRLCVRYYQRRRDGTVLTRDCPVGVRTVRRRLAYTLTCAFTLFIAVASWAARRPARGAEAQHSSWWTQMEAKARGTEPFKSILNLVAPAPVIPMMGKPASAIMGAMAPPPAHPTPGRTGSP
jgi:hypothetical protein